MKFKAFLLLLATASYAHGHVFIFYVMRITNNTKLPLVLHCKNFAYQPVLFSSPKQLNNFRLRDDGKFPTQPELLEKQYNDLLYQMNVLQLRILSFLGDINTNAELNALKQKRLALEQQMFPVIQPGQTVSDLPCRLFSPADTPNMGYVSDWNNKGAQMLDILHWKLSETYVEIGGSKIDVIDSNQQGDCPVGYIKVFARSGSNITSVCVEDDPNSRIHLIVNPDGFELKTFKMYALQ